jgi:uncharacterized membrane protein (DUF2068 family)
MTHDSRPHAKRGLRLIAVYEAAKGAIVLLAGCGVLALAGRNLQALGESLVDHLHLNPASGMPRVFLHALADVHDRQLWMVAAGAAVYAVVRFVEGWGLWYGRRWAEWLGVVSAGIYVPFELREIAREPSALHFGILAVNLAIIAYLGRELARRRRAEAG